jgi:hypothetical protein
LLFVVPLWLTRCGLIAASLPRSGVAYKVPDTLSAPVNAVAAGNFHRDDIRTGAFTGKIAAVLKGNAAPNKLGMTP